MGIIWLYSSYAHGPMSAGNWSHSWICMAVPVVSAIGIIEHLSTCTYTSTIHRQMLSIKSKLCFCTWLVYFYLYRYRYSVVAHLAAHSRVAP